MRWLALVLALAFAPIAAHAQSFVPSLRGYQGAAPVVIVDMETIGDHTPAGYGAFIVPGLTGTLTLVTVVPTGGGASTDLCLSKDYDGTTAAEIALNDSASTGVNCVSANYGKATHALGTSYVITVSGTPTDGGPATRIVDLMVENPGFGEHEVTTKSHFGYVNNADAGTNGNFQQFQIGNIFQDNGKTPSGASNGIAHTVSFGDTVVLRTDCGCDPSVTPTISPPLNPLSITKSSSGATVNTYHLKSPDLGPSGYTPTTFAGQQPVTINSATYNVMTGLVTATLNTSLGASPGQTISVLQLFGIGVNGVGTGIANGTWTAGAGTSGTTLTWTIPTNLTLSFDSGTGVALLPITIRSEHATTGLDSWGNFIGGGDATLGSVIMDGRGIYGAPTLPSDVTATTTPLPFFFDNVTHAFLHAVVTNEISLRYLVDVAPTTGSGTTGSVPDGWNETNGQYFLGANLAEQCLIYFCEGVRQAGGSLTHTHFTGPWYGHVNAPSSTDNPGPNISGDLFEDFVQAGISTANLYNPTFDHDYFYNLGPGVPQPYNGMQIYIAGTLYTFVTAAPVSQGQVQIDPNGNWEQSLMNFVCAVDGNTTGGAGSNVVNWGVFQGGSGTFNCGDGNPAHYPVSGLPAPARGVTNSGAQYPPTYSAEAPDANVSAAWWYSGPNYSANLTALATGTAINTQPVLVASGNVGTCNANPGGVLAGCWSAVVTNPASNLFVGGFQTGGGGVNLFGCGAGGGGKNVCLAAGANAGFAITAGAAGVQATNQVQFDTIHSDCIINVSAASPPPAVAGSGFPMGQLTSMKCIIGNRQPNVYGSSGLLLQDGQHLGFPSGYVANNVIFNDTVDAINMQNNPGSEFDTNTVVTDFTSQAWQPTNPSYGNFTQFSWTAQISTALMDQAFVSYTPPGGITSGGTVGYNLANRISFTTGSGITAAVQTPNPNETVIYGGQTQIAPGSGNYNHLTNVITLTIPGTAIYNVGDFVRLLSLTGTGSVASLSSQTLGPVLTVSSSLLNGTITLTGPNPALGSDATITGGTANQTPQDGQGVFSRVMQPLFPNLPNTSVAPCGPPCTPASVVAELTPAAGTIFTASTTTGSPTMSIASGWVPVVGVTVNGPVGSGDLPAGDIVVGCASPCNAFPYSVTLQSNATGNSSNASFATGAMNPDGTYNGAYTPHDVNGVTCDNIKGVVFNGAATCAAQSTPMTPSTDAADVFQRWDALPANDNRERWAA